MVKLTCTITPPEIITNHPVLVPTALNSVIILFYSCEQSS